MRTAGTGARRQRRAYEQRSNSEGIADTGDCGPGRELNGLAGVGFQEEPVLSHGHLDSASDGVQHRRWREFIGESPWPAVLQQVST
jgi:hypothetical protein